MRSTIIPFDRAWLACVMLKVRDHGIKHPCKGGGTAGRPTGDHSAHDETSSAHSGSNRGQTVKDQFSIELSLSDRLFGWLGLELALKALRGEPIDCPPDAQLVMRRLSEKLREGDKS